MTHTHTHSKPAHRGADSVGGRHAGGAAQRVVGRGSEQPRPLQLTKQRLGGWGVPSAGGFCATTDTPPGCAVKFSGFFARSPGNPNPAQSSMTSFISSFVFDTLSRICQGLFWQRLHRPCVAGEVHYSIYIVAILATFLSLPDRARRTPNDPQRCKHEMASASTLRKPESGTFSRQYLYRAWGCKGPDCSRERSLPGDACSEIGLYLPQ